MGTDLHLMVEVQMDDGWMPVVDKIWPNDQGHEGSPWDVTPVIDRHYGLHSVLADVRNKSGRGSVMMMPIHHPETGEFVDMYRYDTDDGGHDPLIPISLPRGIPEDVNPIWRDWMKQENVGLHDPSWLTLEDIEGNDGIWDQVLYEQAVVSEVEYKRYLADGTKPTMHARASGGPGARTVTEVEYAAGERGEESTAIDMRWKGNTVRDDVPKSWWATVAVMHIVEAKTGRPIRLLISFDS